MDYYAAINKSEIMKFTFKWMKLKTFGFMSWVHGGIHYFFFTITKLLYCTHTKKENYNVLTKK